MLDQYLFHGIPGQKQRLTCDPVNSTLFCSSGADNVIPGWINLTNSLCQLSTGYTSLGSKGLWFDNLECWGAMKSADCSHVWQESQQSNWPRWLLCNTAPCSQVAPKCTDHALHCRWQLGWGMALGDLGWVQLIQPLESPCSALCSQEKQTVAAGRWVSSSQWVCPPPNRSRWLSSTPDESLITNAVYCQHLGSN